MQCASIECNNTLSNCPNENNAELNFFFHLLYDLCLNFDTVHILKFKENNFLNTFKHSIKL